MSQQTYNDQFNSATASLISTILITPIVNYYKEHAEEAVTEEKILEILNMPAPVHVNARTPQRGTAMATTQSLATGAATKRTRASKVSDRPQCKWVFTKGANFGKQCPSPAAEDSEYCSTCRNKRGAGGKGRPTSGSSGTRSSSSTTRNSNATAKQNGFTPASKQQQQSPQEDDKEVSVDAFGKTTDGCELFIEPSTNFVLKSEGDDDYIVVGVGVYEDGGKKKRVKPLTDKDKDRVKKELGLACVDEVITLADDEEEEKEEQQED